MKSTSKKRTPSIVNLTVKRRYLTQREIERLMDCARKHGRYGHRDATMILAAYRHGLRASEVCDLQWQQVQRLLEGLTMAGPARGPSPLCGKLALSARHACRRGDKSCDHVRGRPFLVLHTRGPIAVSASIINRFGLRLG